MLKQRVITASLLAIVFISVLFYLPWFLFTLLIGIVVSIGAWEWAHLSGLSTRLEKAGYLFFVMGLCVACGWVSDWASNTDALLSIFVVASAWWAVSLLWIQGFPSSTAIWGSKPVRLLMGILVLIPAWLGCLYLRVETSGSWLVLLVVLLVSAADIGAYFTGKAIGKRRLAPDVSPGKSWEGVIGGLVFALFVAAGFNFIHGGNQWLSLFAIVVPTALVSVIGDLLESMVKRHRGVKDSSNLLPGHGGMLDRIDGLVAAVPVFALALMSSAWRI